MHLENRDNSLFLHYTFRLDLVEKKWYTDFDILLIIFLPNSTFNIAILQKS